MEDFPRRRSVPIYVQQEHSSRFCRIRNVSAATPGHEKHNAVLMECRHPTADDPGSIHIGNLHWNAYHASVGSIGTQPGTVAGTGPVHTEHGNGTGILSGL